MLQGAKAVLVRASPTGYVAQLKAKRRKIVARNAWQEVTPEGSHIGAAALTSAVVIARFMSSVSSLRFLLLEASLQRAYRTLLLPPVQGSDHLLDLIEFLGGDAGVLGADGGHNRT